MPTATDPAPSSGVRAVRLLGTLAGVFLGSVLLLAAVTKVLDPEAFAEQIHREGLDALLTAPTVALVALGLELGLGFLLVLGVRRYWVLVPAALLVGIFLFLTGRAYWLDAHGLLPPDASCGCFGNLVERTPAQAFWQDLLLLVPPLGLAFLGRARGARAAPLLRTATAATLTLAGLLLAARAPQLPLDDLATRLRPGVAPAELCMPDAGGGQVCLTTVVPELQGGHHVVVLAELSSDELGAAVPELNRFVYDGAGDGTAPRLWVLAATTPEEVNAFFWQRGPAFEIRETPLPLLRPLYRRLPRSFVVLDGTVTATYRGLPPLDELGAEASVAALPGSPAGE